MLAQIRCGCELRASPCGRQTGGSPIHNLSLCPCRTQHILYCIVDSECKSRDVLQSYFDLLGELMKFNVDAFKRFNKYINTDAKVRLARALWGVRLENAGDARAIFR